MAHEKSQSHAGFVPGDGWYTYGNASGDWDDGGGGYRGYGTAQRRARSAMMAKPAGRGFGWVPDLPDHRDLGFDAACASAVQVAMTKGGNEGNSSTSAVAKAGLHNKRSGESHREAWIAAHLQSKFFQENVTRGASPFENPLCKTRYQIAMEKAFPKSHANRESILLPSPPSLGDESIDLSVFMSPVDDQEYTDSCTAHAVVGLIEYLQIATAGVFVDASRLFLYKATRDLLHWTGDSGAYIRSTIKALSITGICAESYFPFIASDIDLEPSPYCYALAANSSPLSYCRLSTLEQIKSSLAQGYPVVFGFTCFQSLFSDEVTKTGIISEPLSIERPLGGHALLAVGYSDNDQTIKVRNSWGTRWGQAGYGVMPYSYFNSPSNANSLSDDYWTLASVHLFDTQGASAAGFWI